MISFKNILFPVDLSPASQKIVPYVNTMAEKFGSNVCLFFVARNLKYFADMYVPDPSIFSFEREILEGSTKRLTEFKEKYFQDMPKVQIKVVSGDPAGEILHYIKNETVDMVIMGTHGRKGLDKIVFGSVADRIVKSSLVPVLLINPYKDDKES
jgi:nucleotide-binding universal stress UspA family protein